MNSKLQLENKTLEGKNQELYELAQILDQGARNLKMILANVYTILQQSEKVVEAFTFNINAFDENYGPGNIRHQVVDELRNTLKDSGFDPDEFLGPGGEVDG